LHYDRLDRQEAIGSHNALIIIRPASIDPPPSRIGSVDGGYAARALARYAAIHSAERPPHMGACANARSVRLPAIVPDRKTKAAKRKQQVRVSLKTIFLPLSLTVAPLRAPSSLSASLRDSFTSFRPFG